MILLIINWNKMFCLIVVVLNRMLFKKNIGVKVY